MDFFQVLPQEVIVKNILPNLSGNDLLRFRRVCRLAKVLADDHMRMRSVRTQREVEIRLRHIVPMGREDYESHENVKDLNWSGSGDTRVGGGISKMLCLKETKIKGTLGYILNMDHLFSMGKLYLDSCCMHDLWKNPEIPKFMFYYHGQITHLRLNLINLPLEKEAIHFLGKFINLRVFEVEEVSTTQSFQMSGPWEDIPLNFRNLKTLKIQRFTTPPLEQSGSPLWTTCNAYYNRYCRFVRECCVNGPFEHVLFPAQIHVPGKDKLYFIQPFVECLIDIIQSREKNQPGQPNLKEVDLKYFWFPGPSLATLRKLLEFANLCKKYDIKLFNFDRTICQSLLRSIPRDEGATDFMICMTECVASVRNLHDLQFWAELAMPCLERILISKTSLCGHWRGAAHRTRRPDWDQLKTIHMTVAPNKTGDAESFEISVALFRFLFDGIVRESVTELKLKFIESSASFVCPIAHYISSACPNLKILAIDHWTDGIQQLPWLWTELTGLEELFLGNCPGIDINSFTGGNYRHPSFLNLTGLKKLKLNNLENMPKIDDSFLIVILWHMSLRELELNCEKPIKTFTVHGIHTLLKSRFAMTIEKFPLVGHLKLDGVSEKEMRQLEKKFRSSLMI